jgi:uncharacterized membrane protein (UPF0182 family)
LQRVLMSYGDGGSYVVLANNVADGIKQLVEQGKQAATPGAPPPTGGTPPGGTPPALTGELAEAADRVQSAITEVRAAQTSGDFERYGRALKALDEALTAFQQAQRAAAAPTPGATPSGSPPASPAASGSAAPTPSG